MANNFMNKIEGAGAEKLKKLSEKIPNQTSTKPSNGSIDSSAKAIVELFNKNNGKNSILLRGLDLDKIQASNWTAIYPYRFILYTVSGDGGTTNYKEVTSVTLPITPQDLQITTQFASQVSAASRGVLEENNGIVFKNINFNATTGILTNRGVFNQETVAKTNMQTIFAGTIAAVDNVRSAVASIFPKAQAALPLTPTNDLVFTGYYQYHLVRAFLEMYAHLKSQANGRGYRLGFETGKDRVIYLITPQAFTSKKSAANPMEITYSFGCTAWGTVPEQSGSKAQASSQIIGNNINQIQKILNGLNKSRTVFQSLNDVIRGVKADYDANIIGPMNNIILTVKEALDIPKNIADFPDDINASTITTIVSTTNKSITDFIGADLLRQFKEAQDAALPEVNPIKDVPGGKKPNLPKGGPKSGNSWFSGSGWGSFWYNVANSVPVNAIPTTPEQQAAMEDAVANAFLTTTNSRLVTFIEDLEQMSAALEAQALSQGVDSPAWDILYATYDTIDNTYSLLSDNFYGTHTVGEQQGGANPLLDFYQGYAASGGINFTKTNSKFSIPFPFRVTLEWLAQRYLGDATRWIEIAAVNNLQSPYIDEDGFYYEFLTNGNDRQFNINSSKNLFVSQSIWIMSNNKTIQKRTIKSIQKITDSNFIITVDGDNNLSEYKSADKAKMKAFLPNTVNSQKLIYIPIDAPSNLDSVQTKPITFIDETPEMLAMSKIDLLLDQNGDLAVTQDGFQNLAYGKQNLIQAATLKLKTVAGSLLLHPTFGAGQDVGDSEADFTIDTLINGIKDSFADDARFESVDNIEIQQQPGVLSIKVFLTAADNQGIVPVEFTVQQ